MSFPEKQDSPTKDQWAAKLKEGSYMQKLSMNNLIMNYLVTGGRALSFPLCRDFILHPMDRATCK